MEVPLYAGNIGWKMAVQGEAAGVEKEAKGTGRAL
jgi:hypothetical protein